jgi:branched-chain amino acid transport system substrate-binding protein
MSRAAHRIFAVAAVAGLIATGCGSSKSSSSSSTTAPSSNATSPSSNGASPTSAPTAATGSTVTIGTIASITGPLAAGVNTDIPVMQAWISDVNASGGINGHPIKLIVKDDGGSATTGVSDFQQLQQQHVVAIVNEASLVDVDWAPLAQKANLPVIGGSSVQVAYDISPDFFSSSTNLFAAVYEDMVLAKKYGPDIAILPCTEAPTCSASVAIYKAFAPSLGMTVGFNEAIAASTPDFTAACQALKASHAQSYVVVDSVAVELRVSNTCVQQGVTAKLIESSGAVGPELLTQPGAQGLLAADVNFPFITDNTPATEKFHSVLQKYAPSDLSDQPATNVTWAAMELFGAALQGVGSGAVTSKSLEQALYSLPKNDTLGGLAPPLNFAPGQIGHNDCSFVLGIAGGKYVAPQGATPTCAPAAVVDGVATSFLSHAGT